MTEFINLVIDEGNHLLADDLEVTGLKYENDNDAEVKAWLKLNTLENYE